MEMSNEVGELFAALAEAQGKLTGVAKDSQNPMLKNQYAGLDSVLASVRPVFSSCGLSFVQGWERDGSNVLMTTTIGHKSGQWMKIPAFGEVIPAGKRTTAVQMLGATVTYLRRYATMAMAGIAPEDTDGNPAEVVKERKEGRTPMGDLEDAARAAGISVDDVVAYAAAQPKMGSPTRDPRAAAVWLAGPGGPKVRAWVIERDRQEPAAEAEPATEPEPAKWSKAQQAGFFAAVQDHVGPTKVCTYDELAAWCTANGRPRPSVMPEEQRAKLVAAIVGAPAIAVDVAEWAAKQAADEVTA